MRVGRDRCSEGSTLTLLNGCEDIRSNTFLILMSHPIPVWCTDPKVNFNGSLPPGAHRIPSRVHAGLWHVSNQQNMVWGDIIPLIMLHYISLHFSRIERETFCRLDEISDHVRERKQVTMLDKGKELCSLQELWMASMAWGESLAESQQKARALSHTITRILILSTTWMRLEADSAPVKPLDENAAQITPCSQPCETNPKQMTQLSCAQTPDP